MKIESIDLNTGDVIVQTNNGRFKTNIADILERLTDQVRIGTSGMEKLLDD